jgi:hypothetical protein
MFFKLSAYVRDARSNMRNLLLVKLINGNASIRLYQSRAIFRPTAITGVFLGAGYQSLQSVVAAFLIE